MPSLPSWGGPSPLTAMMEWAVTPSAMGSEDSVLMDGWEGDMLSTALGIRSKAALRCPSLLRVSMSVATPAANAGSLMKRVSHPTMPIAGRGGPRWGGAAEMKGRGGGAGAAE